MRGRHRSADSPSKNGEPARSRTSRPRSTGRPARSSNGGTRPRRYLPARSARRGSIAQAVASTPVTFACSPHLGLGILTPASSSMRQGAPGRRWRRGPSSATHPSPYRRPTLTAVPVAHHDARPSLDYLQCGVHRSRGRAPSPRGAGRSTRLATKRAGGNPSRCVRAFLNQDNAVRPAEPSEPLRRRTRCESS